MGIEEIINYKVHSAKHGLSVFKQRFKQYLNANVHIVLIPEYDLAYFNCVVENLDYIYVSDQFNSICLGLNEKFMDKLDDCPFETQNNSVDIIPLTESECQNIIELSNLFAFCGQVSIIAFNSINYRGCYDTICLEDKILYGVLNISSFYKKIAQYTIGNEINFSVVSKDEYLARGVSSKEECGAWALKETDLYLELGNYIEGRNLIVTMYFSRVLNLYQTVLISVNGQTLPTYKIKSSRLQFYIPSTFVLHSKISLKFIWPLASATGSDTRVLSVMLKKMILEMDI